MQGGQRLVIGRRTVPLRFIRRSIMITALMIGMFGLPAGAYLELPLFDYTLVLMRAGRIVQQGCIDELLAAPADAFVGQFVRAQRRLHDDGGEHP